MITTTELLTYVDKKVKITFKKDNGMQQHIIGILKKYYYKPNFYFLGIDTLQGICRVYEWDIDKIEIL